MPVRRGPGGRVHAFVSELEEWHSRPSKSPPRRSEPVTLDIPLWVGRSAELAALNRSFALADSGEVQFTMVTGQAGVGKTTLIADVGSQAIDAARGGCR
jgi:Cdc6-like AAA superfamily ATPase